MSDHHRPHWLAQKMAYCLRHMGSVKVRGGARFCSQSQEEQPRQVMDAQHRFAKKRYDDKYRWTPSPELEAAIVPVLTLTQTGLSGYVLA